MKDTNGGRIFEVDVDQRALSKMAIDGEEFSPKNTWAYSGLCSNDKDATRVHEKKRARTDERIRQ